MKTKFLLFFSLIIILFSCENSIQTNTLETQPDESSNLVNDFTILIKKRDNAKTNKIQENINLGDFFKAQNENNQALKYYLIALEIAKETNEIELTNTTIRKLGEIYLLNEDFDKASIYLKQSFSYSKRENDTQLLINDLMMLGYANHWLENLDTARIYYKQIKKITYNTEFKTELVQTINNLGELYLHDALYEEAKLVFSMGIDSAITYNKPEELPLLEFNLGKTYAALQEYQFSKEHLLIADSIFYFQKNKELISECKYWLARVELLIKSDKETLFYLEESKSWNDSIAFKRNEEWQQHINFNYQIGRKEGQIQFLNTKMYYQQLITFIIIIATIIFIILLIIYWRIRTRRIKQHNLLLRERDKIKTLKEKQLQHKIDYERLKHEKDSHLINLELELKNKEILSNNIILMNKNEMMDSLKVLTAKIQTIDNINNKNLVNEMLTLLKDNTNIDNTWKDFKIHFEKVHQEFFTKLKQQHPDLQQNDVRLSAYLLIGMQNQEIANFSFVSSESIRKRKQRLREKLNIESGTDLSEYLASL